MKWIFLFFIIFVFSQNGNAGNPGISYQGRILKPDGTALESSAVQFRMQIRSPGAENCLLFEETQTLNMSSSLGVFSITLNDGSGTRTDTPTYQIDRTFANRGTMTLDSSRCAVGTSYSPGDADGRKFIVYFKDETMSQYEPLPTMSLNYTSQAMYALESQKLGDFSASSVLRAVDGSGNPTTASALDPTQLANLTSLLAGTSTQYATNTQFNSVQTFAKSSLPTCSAGQVLKSDGSSFSCVTSSSAPSYSSITGAAGTNTIDNTLFSQIWNWSTASTQNPMTMSANSLTTGSVLNVTTSSSSLNSTDGVFRVANTGSATSGILTRFQANSTSGSGMTILGNGNVGIGTASPAGSLEIDPSATSITPLLINVASGQSAAVMSVNKSGTGSLLSLNSAGNLYLPLGYYYGPAYYVWDGGNQNAIKLIGSSRSIEMSVPASNTTDLRLQRSAANTLTLDNGSGGSGSLIVTGNIGVGVSSAGAPLDLNGAIRFRGSTSGYTELRAPAAAANNSLTLPSVAGSANQVIVNDGSGQLGWASTPTLKVVNRYTGFSALNGTQSNVLIASAPTGLYRMTVFAKNSTAASSGSGCSMVSRYFFSSEVGFSNTTAIATTLSGTAGGYSNGTVTFYHADSSLDIRIEIQRTPSTCVGDDYRYDVVLEQIKQF